MLNSFSILAVLTTFGSPVLAQTPTFGQWCGKYYQPGAPSPTARPPGSLFNYPSVSDQPLLDFQCSTKSSLYIEGDDQYDPPQVLVDLNITSDVGQAYHGDWNGSVRVDVWSDNENYLGGNDFPLNSLGNLLSFNVSGLTASSTSYNLTCKAQVNGQTYYTNSTLAYLPQNPYGGNTVKIDRSSQALLVRNETGGDKTWNKIIPFGYYDSYNSTSSAAVCGNNTDCGTDAVQDTLDRLQMAKDLGFNLVHTVPPGGFYPYTFDDDATAQFEKYLSTAESLGLLVQYDMRNSYTNLSSVAYQVDYLRNRSNVLMWYTGDEPDGAVDPLNATRLAYDLIYEHDGYHPVSLVLNCENYFFDEYGLQGADIIMVDPYPIDMNARWSRTWFTYVDENYGDSGCDNCNGNFYDISTRIDSTRDRARVMGQYRTKPAWIVPQAFDGQTEFWNNIPTGAENTVNNALCWNHGGQGSVAWNSQYSTQDLLKNSSEIANLLYSQSRFVVDAYDSRHVILSNQSYNGINGIDIAGWSIPNSNGTGKTETLVMAVNTLFGPNDGGDSYRLTFALQNYTGSVKEVLYGNVTMGDDNGPVFIMPRTSVAAVILEM